MNAKLLLIDDDLRLTAMVGDYLRANGYEVDTAGSLGAGRERLRAVTYDALVLDLMLPDGDGLDLTRELRADARLKRLPLLMLTARGEPLDRVRKRVGYVPQREEVDWDFPVSVMDVVALGTLAV